MAKPAVDIGAMTRDERLELLEDLWDSLGQDAEALPLTEEQRLELDRRLDALDREGPIGVSPAELRGRIRVDAPVVAPAGAVRDLRVPAGHRRCDLGSNR